ncbi:MAG: sodium:proline symporter, partial [Nitrospirae bacterium]
MNITVLLTFLVYLLGMLFIGVLFYRKAGDLSDYILGGRRLGSFVAALSVGASDMSGWLLLGLPGAVYASGLNQIWIAIGLTIGAYLNWQFLAPRLRTFTERAGNALTISDFLEYRFNDRSHSLRLLSALAIMLFFGIYTAAGLVGGAVLFKNTFGIDYQTALWVGAAVIISYTFLGGFLAVCWTDFFQGSLMLLALLAVPVTIIAMKGGPSETLAIISSKKQEYTNALAGLDVLRIASLMAWGLGYFGQPHILARFMAVRTQGEIPK